MVGRNLSHSLRDLHDNLNIFTVCWNSKPMKIVQLPCDSQVTSSVLGDVSLEMVS